MKSNLNDVIKQVQKSFISHSPEILTGVGIAGFVMAGIWAVKNTPKAVELIKHDSRKAHDGNSYAYTKTEAVKSCWKCYVPSVIMSGVSAGCLIGAVSINCKRNAALITACTLSETALKEYQAKVVDTIGEKKDQAIRDSISQDKVDANPVKDTEIIITDTGTTLCYDEISGRYFMSDMETIRRAQNEINRMLIDEGTASLNDFYYEIHLENTGAGEQLGWHIDTGMMDITFGAVLTPEKKPCISVGHRVPPKANFTHIM